MCPVVLAVEHDRVKHGVYNLLKVPECSMFFQVVAKGKRDAWINAGSPPRLGLNNDEVAVLPAAVSETS